MSDIGKKLPGDGTEVKAMTYPSLEYDREPEKITGKLITQPSPFGGSQCWVDGVQVEETTVESVEGA